MVYSPGEGPVPFVYPAEGGSVCSPPLPLSIASMLNPPRARFPAHLFLPAFPLYVRDLGMSWAFEINWFFNALVALTFPSLLASFGNQGAFSYYATWDALLFIVIFLVLPETRGLVRRMIELGLRKTTRVARPTALSPTFFGTNRLWKSLTQVSRDCLTE